MWRQKTYKTKKLKTEQLLLAMANTDKKTREQMVQLAEKLTE